MKKRSHLQDAWGNDYLYQSPASNGDAFELICLGSDGEEGGEKFAADLSNLTIERLQMYFLVPMGKSGTTLIELLVVLVVLAALVSISAVDWIANFVETAASRRREMLIDFGGGADGRGADESVGQRDRF